MPASHCTGPIQRREFLRVGTLALGGVMLPDLLRLQAASEKLRPTTSVILFWMWGGPSQLETYDMKPDAPSEYRGPLNPIRTNVPGMDICEYMPLQAKIADKFSIIRSLHHEMSAHNDGSIEVLTGQTPSVPDPTSQAHSKHPDFGMVASRIRGPHPEGLPQYIGVQRSPFMTQPNYLGAAHRSFDTGDPSLPGYAPKNLTLATGVDHRRLGDRKHLLGQFDRFRQRYEHDIDGADEFQSAAFSILTSRKVADAFEIAQEDPKLRDRYGRHRWGQSCLLARRLAEAGAAVINVDATAPNSTTKNFSWDDHAGAFHLDYAQRERLPQMDQALSALITDLHDRGLNENVLVIACGEFGRTPRVTHAPTNFSNQIGLGRDHWPGAFSALIAGGGLRMGQVVGQTNSNAEYPLHDPVTPQDLLATVYRHLGVDPQQQFTSFAGRPIPILPSGQPIKQLI
ncbi:hypothetical protein Pan258_18970 [Symmachiella dynata]|uniref:DUF1501 domain-containing protein n=1 Tax=Symmachiella dynata TaxID=2527995 RepID=UPI00118C2FAB|nr:DUF1501 domain-containing protein [Symmachiella dynata]QDT47858.1 hypothetical protein Pan258_18970 [Symmachiella dynata]